MTDYDRENSEDAREAAAPPLQRAAIRLGKRSRLEIIIAIFSIVSSIFSLIESLRFVAPGKDISRVIEAFFGVAHAGQLNAAAANSDVSIRETFPAVFLFGIFVILIGSFYFALFSKRPKTETDRAWDLIKIIAGFFIGILSKGLQ